MTNLKFDLQSYRLVIIHVPAPYLLIIFHHGNIAYVLTLISEFN